MLNRTNRTLSANLNRLNLGTRSLVLNTSGTNGKSILRVRHAHGFAMRDGMHLELDPSIRFLSRSELPGIPCSFPAFPWRGVSAPLPAVVRPVDGSTEVVTRVQPQAPALKTRACARPVKPGHRASTARAARPAAAAIAAATAGG
jgi:hypothetical protein